MPWRPRRRRWSGNHRLNQVKLERAEHRRNHLDDIEALLGPT